MTTVSSREGGFKDAVKMVLLKDIKWEKRYREDLGDIETLTESIKDKGILQPITISKDYVLLAGERRVTAARAAGLEKIPALIRDVQGEVDAREIELIENTFRKDFTWVEEAALILEIDRLYKSKNYDWSGRKTAQLLNKGVASVSRALQLAKATSVIPELGEYKTADEALRVLKKMEEGAIITELRDRQKASITGKTYDRGMEATLRIADANYMIGDAFLGLSEYRSEGVVHLIECDPPYGIELNEQKASKDSVVSTVTSYHEIKPEEYNAFLKKITGELYRVAGKDCWLIFWYGPTWHTQVKVNLQSAGWQVDEIPAVWVKPQGQTLQPEKYFARCYESFFLCRKGNPIMVKRGRSNVFQYSPVSGAKKYHPTQRPIELMEELLSTLCVPRQVVLVPFLGSGTTLRACYNLGMLGGGFDTNHEYKDKFMLAVEDDARRLLNNDDSNDPDELDPEDIPSED